MKKEFNDRIIYKDVIRVKRNNKERPRHLCLAAAGGHYLLLPSVQGEGISTDNLVRIIALGTDS